MAAENFDQMTVQKKSLVSNVQLHPECKANAAHGNCSNMPNKEASFSFVLPNNDSTNNSKRPLVDESLNNDIIKKCRLAENIDNIINNYLTTETSLSNTTPELNNESSSAAIVNKTNHENDEIIQSPIVIENEVEMIKIDPVCKDKVIDRIKDITDNNGIDHSNNNNDGKDNNHKDIEIILSDSNSDFSDDDELYNEELVNNIINGIKKLNKINFLRFIKVFGSSQELLDQFDSYCTQKIIAVFTEKGDFGVFRFKLQLLEHREKIWKTKYNILARQLSEFKSVLKKREVTIDKLAKPHIIKRNVGLQVFIPQKTQVLQKPISSKRTNHVQLPNAAAQNSAGITVIIDDDDDDDDVVFIDKVINKSTLITKNAIPKKVLTSQLTTPKTKQIIPKQILTSKPTTPKIIETMLKKASIPSTSKTKETIPKEVLSSTEATSKTIETITKKVLSSSQATSKTIETITKKVISSTPFTSETTETTRKKVSCSILSTSKTTGTIPKNASCFKPSITKTIKIAPKKNTITPSSLAILERSTVNKVGPTSSPLNIANTDINCTIDLTEEDDIIDVTNVTNRLKTKHPPNKIVKNSTINISAGTTSQLKYLTSNVDLSSVAFINLPKFPQTASSYMVNTSSTTGMTQLMTIPINPPQPINPLFLRNGRALPIQIVNSASSFVNSATSVVYSTSSVVPASQVPVALHPLPRRRLARSLPPVPPAIPIVYHPADLPTIPKQKSLSGWKKLPPAPILSRSVSTENSKALILSWNMNLSSLIADIITYQIYAYHEVATELPRQELWKNIGEVNALPLPMACSLSQFSSGENYHFAVRAVDIHARVGPFSQILSIHNLN